MDGACFGEVFTCSGVESACSGGVCTELGGSPAEELSVGGREVDVEPSVRNPGINSGFFGS